MPKFRKILLIILVNSGILAVLLLATEITLRIAGIPYPEKFSPTENAVAQFDKELGWSYIPNMSKTLKFGSNVRTVYFDEHGIRVPSKGFTLSSSRPSVLFIGCSITMGHGLSYEESFVGQFAKMAGSRYQTVNLGVQAYGTDQALIALKKFAPRFNVKTVVYTFKKDHIYRNGNYDRRYLYPQAKIIGTKPLFQLDRHGKVYLAKAPLLYKDFLNSYLVDLLFIKLEIPVPYPEQLTKALIREMHAYCSSRNIRFVMVNMRTHEEDYNDFEGETYDIIDTMRDAPIDWANMVIPYDGHPDAEACSYIARSLINYFRQHPLP